MAGAGVAPDDSDAPSGVRHGRRDAIDARLLHLYQAMEGPNASKHDLPHS